MRREHLKDGGWVDIRNAEEVTQRGRRAIQAIAIGLGEVLGRKDLTPDTLLSDLNLTEEQADAMIRMQEATIVAMVAGWSRPEPVPTMATVGDMPGALFDELSKLTSKEGASLTLDTTPSLEVDPKDLSGNSDNSDGASKDVKDSVTESTQTLPSDGVLTVTGS